MQLSIKLLKPFSDAVGKGELKMEFEGKTIDDLIAVLVETYPKLAKEVYDKDGKTTDYLSLFVNDQPAHCLDDSQTELKDGDSILFFFPVAGG
jgi:MoaD family protein